MSEQKETITTANSDGQGFRRFIPITNDNEQLQAFASLYEKGISKEDMILILTTVRISYDAVGISPQPLLNSLSTYLKR